MRSKLKCWKCQKTKPIARFNNDITRPSGKCSRCKDCNRVHYAAFRVKMKGKLGQSGYREYFSKYELSHYYGITIDDFKLRLKQQNNLCAICNGPPTGRRLGVDHCHRTGKFRGLLCGRCNSALGLFRDNIENLETALEYLREHK